MNILSIQSHVVYGHAGNSAAVFPMQRLGAEVWPLHTVQFSNHTAYGQWTGEVFTADQLRALVDGLEARGVLGQCDAVVSGFMGDVSLGEVILEAKTRVKAANPQALYLCDPVMGNPINGCTVRPEIPPYHAAHTVPAADIATPSALELERLTGVTPKTFADSVEAVRAVQASGPHIVLAKSLSFADKPEDKDLMLAVEGANLWQVITPHAPVDKPLVGTGDLIAGVFLVQYLKTRSVPEALGHAAAAVYAVADATQRANTWELQIVATQEEIVKPKRLFPVEQLA
ncbi:MAG: pyridoxal kinase PdxY [Candidatus Competibacterales bacterium]